MPQPAASRYAPPDSLLDSYLDLFDVASATTPEQRREVHELRYQVYCVDNAFEDPAQHPGGLERDEFDDRSVHSLLVHRSTGRAIGTVRLILPSSHQRAFPVQDVYREPWPCPLRRTAEISRFSVSKEARLWLARHGAGERQVMPFITLGLMRAIVHMTAASGVEFWCAAMEPTLLRLLARLGIHFERLGGLVDYHGVRQPCYAHAASLLDGIRRERPEVWDVITDEGRLLPYGGGRA